MYKITGPLIVCYLLITSTAAYADSDIRISIKGIDDQLKNNALAFLSIHTQKKRTDLSAARIQQLHKKATKEIQQALQPFGYYHATVDAKLSKQPTGWLAQYQVNKGPPVHITSLDIQVTGEGNEDSKFFNLINNFPLQLGNILAQEKYEAAKSSFLEISTERGYLDAEFNEHKILIDLTNNTAKIVLIFHSGQRYQFGVIRFHQTILSNRLMQTFLTFKVGDPYSINQLLALQKALSDSNYFIRSDVTTRRDIVSGLRLPIDVLLQPRKRNQYTAGFGYGTDTRARASMGWSNRRINRQGHRLALKLTLSEIQNSQTLQYIIPIHYQRAEQLAITGTRRHNFLGDKDDILQILSVSHSSSLGILRQTLAINYRFEEFVINKQRNFSTLFMPSVSWEFVDADNRVHPKKGHRINWDIRGASEDLLSDTKFIQTELEAKWVYAFWSQYRLITRAHGATSLVSKFSELPSSLRFLAGGDHSVRGYAVKSLGPSDNEGGKHLLTGSLELERTIIGKWSFAIFIDAGNAFDEVDLLDIKQGIGSGIRWQSPIGPIRVDFARQLDFVKPAWQIHLTIGPDI